MAKIIYLESSVKAGFPSPAEDYREKTIDVSEYLIEHPHATFILRLSGDSMEGKKLFDGDYIVVDKSLNPQTGKTVVAEIDGKFTCKELQKDTKGNIYLKSYNPKYKPIYPKEGETLSVWGVVVGSFRKI